MDPETDLTVPQSDDEVNENEVTTGHDTVRDRNSRTTALYVITAVVVIITVGVTLLNGSGGRVAIPPSTKVGVGAMIVLYVGWRILPADIDVLGRYWRVVPLSGFVAVITSFTSRRAAVLIALSVWFFLLSAHVTGWLVRDHLQSAGVSLRTSGFPWSFAASDAIVFDKTGTLTTYEAEVVALTVADTTDFSATEPARDQLLRIVATAEAGSDHPIARAVCERAVERDLSYGTPDDTEVVLGRGILAEVDGANVAVGNRKLLQSNGVEYEDIDPWLREQEDQGRVTVLVARSNQLLGAFALNYEYRPDGKIAGRRVESLGREAYLLTGDNSRTTSAAVEANGIPDEQIIADVMGPQAKRSAISSLPVASPVMVGDGANDVEALRAASVGIAFSEGNELAREVSDAIVSDLPTLFEAFTLADRLHLRVSGGSLVLSVSTILLATLGYTNSMFILTQGSMIVPFVPGVVVLSVVYHLSLVRLL